jgi:uncharacterized membrane protein YidH (DUF202 family)
MNGNRLRRFTWADRKEKKKGGQDMNSFNMAVTIVFVGMLMLLWGTARWNHYQDRKKREKVRKEIADRFNWM